MAVSDGLCGVGVEPGEGVEVPRWRNVMRRAGGRRRGGRSCLARALTRAVAWPACSGRVRLRGCGHTNQTSTNFNPTNPHSTPFQSNLPLSSHPTTDPLARPRSSASPMADPLGGTPQSISPFAPRSPLPGQHSYRAQPLPPPPNNSAWSSPPSTPQPHNGQAHPQAHAPGGWAGSSSQASSAGSARGGMTPRSPQGQGYERRSLGETSDDLGQNGGASAAGEGRSGEGAAVRAEPSVRVRVTGLDRNRRDFFVKFNAEVTNTNK